MKIDRRGDIGFMEAMAGAMTVCIVMMVFVAYVAADVAYSHQEDPDFDWSYIKEVGVTDSQATVTFSSDPLAYIETSGLLGLCVKTVPPTSSDLESSQYEFGQKGDSKYIERKLFSVTNGQEIIPVSVEVTLCR